MNPQKSEPNTEDTVAAEVSMTQPVIVDLGKQTAAKLKDLKEGEGELWDEVLDVVAEVKEMLGEDADGKVMVPLVLIYQKKQRRRRLEKVLFPLVDWDDIDDNDNDDDDEEED